jgi:hypothetical protein
MKKLIPNISKMVMGGEPPRKPIYVSDENDKRLKSYRDSLDAYDTGQQSYKFGKQIYDQVRKPINDEFRKNYTIKQIKNNHREKNPYGDTGIYPISGYTEKYIQKPTSLKDKLFGNTPNKYYVGNDKKLYDPAGTTWSVFAKPVQPVEYRPKVTPTVITKSKVIPKVTPTVNNKKIQMETNKIDTVPKITNFEQRIQNPVLNMHNKDGTTSTHKMMSFEADGKYYAAPTIVEQNGKLVELTKDEAFKYAMKNKEYKEFKTDKEAKDYANNGYKKGTPLSQTSPTPLTKKQYYEVPDANGKNVLLTPEQFSRMSSGSKNDLMSKSPIMNKPKYFYEMNSNGKRQLVPENKIREYMQTKNK